jgi:hypothetical protein
MYSIPGDALNSRTYHVCSVCLDANSLEFKDNVASIGKS